MKKYLTNSKGSLLVVTLIVGLIISIMIMTAHQLVINHYKLTQSSINATKAHYMAETGVDTFLYELNEICEEIIYSYLELLKEYKVKYLNAGDVDSMIYNLPQFCELFRSYFNIHKNRIEIKRINPFAEYTKPHHYEVKIENYEPFNNRIEVKVKGQYDRARRFIKIEIELPVDIIDGVDEYNLPKTKIKPFEIIRYYQSFGV
ncbi:hypothetical protein RH915_01755 [Serpentinicella sp. ANB-PHB4]|uniref:hypothetical protein n=1 Tax=Serpentinicella sp. ANB-PHB4 TaxID=3074076 RepID=UPI00285DE720|nr:hypothetical protein [Serpentinicella sp. ANB-PHB4]MDR5658206.1 hypothetical protein [Serpentinicella sp. ANB-PHB4]